MTHSDEISPISTEETTSDPIEVVEAVQPRRRRARKRAERYPGATKASGDLELPDQFWSVGFDGPTRDQSSDFARIWRSSARSHVGTKANIFLLTPGMEQAVELRPEIDAVGQPVGEAVAEFSEVVKEIIAGGQNLVPFDDALRVVPFLSVDVAFTFTTEMKLPPVFLQPKFLIVIGRGPPEGLDDSRRLAVFQYGFVTDDIGEGIVGSTPDEKRAGWLARVEIHVGGGRGPAGRPEVKYTMYGDGGLEHWAEKDTAAVLAEDVRNMLAGGEYPL